MASVHTKQLELAITLGKVGAILAIISNVVTIFSGLILLVTGLFFISPDFLTWLLQIFTSPIGLLNSFLTTIYLTENLAFLQFGLIFVGLIFLIFGVGYCFLATKTLTFAKGFATSINQQHTIYMILFAVFLIFSGRFVSGTLIGASGIIAYMNIDPK